MNLFTTLYYLISSVCEYIFRQVYILEYNILYSKMEHHVHDHNRAILEYNILYSKMEHHVHDHDRAIKLFG